MFPLSLLGLGGGGGGQGGGGMSLPLLLQYLLSQQPQQQKVNQPNQKLIKAQPASGKRGATSGTQQLLSGANFGPTNTPPGTSYGNGYGQNSTPGLYAGANSPLGPPGVNGVPQGPAWGGPLGPGGNTPGDPGQVMQSP